MHYTGYHILHGKVLHHPNYLAADISSSLNSVHNFSMLETPYRSLCYRLYQWFIHGTYFSSIYMYLIPLVDFARELFIEEQKFSSPHIFVCDLIINCAVDFTSSLYISRNFKLIQMYLTISVDFTSKLYVSSQKTDSITTYKRHYSSRLYQYILLVSLEFLCEVDSLPFLFH